jgi:murein DD-endopeptidase MepM/ murein hydrolase activator NlpD
MKKLIISEEEKKHILRSHGINESLPDLDAFPIDGGRYNIGWDQKWDDWSNPRGTANTDFSRQPTYAGAGGHLNGHIGVDIFGPRGTAILAPVDGKVKFGGNGLTVIVEDPETGFSHWLGHLDSITVKEGDFVFAGQQVGTLGDSGNAKGTAPHLHYNIYKTSGGFYSGEDPLDILKGAIDKKPKKPSDLEYEDLGSKFKNYFKKFFSPEEKTEEGDIKAEDEVDLWDKMKKVGSVFFDKIKNIFD